MSQNHVFFVSIYVRLHFTADVFFILSFMRIFCPQNNNNMYVYAHNNEEFMYMYIKKVLCRYFVPICMCVSIMYELFSKFNLLTGSQFMAFSNKHIYCAVPCHKTYTRVDMLLWYLQVKYCLFDSFVVFTHKQTYKRY